MRGKTLSNFISAERMAEVRENRWFKKEVKVSFESLQKPNSAKTYSFPILSE